jgi:molybdate transport system regulatory protein
MKVAYKIWLDNNGKTFGRGPVELLKRVEVTKSLNKAASQMGMSYSKAWRTIRTVESRLGFAVLERTTGGLAGGGSRVTPRARDLMQRYEQFERDAETAIAQIYQVHFGNRDPEKTKTRNG